MSDEHSNDYISVICPRMLSNLKIPSPSPQTHQKFSLPHNFLPRAWQTSIPDSKQPRHSDLSVRLRFCAFHWTTCVLRPKNARGRHSQPPTPEICFRLVMLRSQIETPHNLHQRDRLLPIY